MQKNKSEQPTIPEEMPKLGGGIYKHETLGELYDRLQVHQYAVKHCETIVAMLKTVTAEQPTQVDKLVEALREIIDISCFNDGAFESAKYTAEQALAAYEAKR